MSGQADACKPTMELSPDFSFSVREKCTSRMYTQDCFFPLNSSQSVTNDPQTFLGIRSLQRAHYNADFQALPRGIGWDSAGWRAVLGICTVATCWPWTSLLFEEQALEPPAYQEIVTSDKDRRCGPLHSSVSGFPANL